MTLSEIITKIVLFFAIFYGGVAISSYLGKKFREKRASKKRSED